MTSLTPADAQKTLLCPLARTFGAKTATAHCRGEACACWRWIPMTSRDPRFLSAVQREIALMKEERPNAKPELFHKEAVKKVQQDPDAYTFPDPEQDRGYCGVGGPV